MELTRVNIEAVRNGQIVKLTIWCPKSHEPDGELRYCSSWSGGMPPPDSADLTERRKEIWEAVLGWLPD